MSDISKMVNVGEEIRFKINGDEKILVIKELSIKEREQYNAKLIGEARSAHIRKINEIASSLTFKDKTEYLVAATNAMPSFDDQLGSLIFSNNGIRYLIKAASKAILTDKEIDAILDEGENGEAIGKTLKLALKLADPKEDEEEKDLEPDNTNQEQPNPNL